MSDVDRVLLDVILPGADGWSVLRSLRRERQTPVPFPSARVVLADLTARCSCVCTVHSAPGTCTVFSLCYPGA